VRTVKTSSGATAVQIVHSNRRGSRDIEHIGSAHSDAEVEILKIAARQRLAAGQGVLDLGLGVLQEAGLTAASYPTINRRLPRYAKSKFRQRISAACAAQAGLGPASLVLYDVSTLYFETDQGDGFRESGFSKERRLEPQITIGLLTDHRGFPLMLEAFEGNKAETLTMIPTIKSFMAAHQLPDVTIVADAGMVSAANQKAIEDAGLSFIIGARIPTEPYIVTAWTRSTRERTSRTGTCSPSRGRPARATSVGTTRSTTSTRRTGAAAPSRASMSRSPRPNGRSRARPR